MRTMSIVSSHAGTGKTTVAVNAAKGLERQGHRVIMHEMGHSDDLCNWLGKTTASEKIKFNSGHILHSLMGVDILINDTEEMDLAYYNDVHALMEEQGYDYFILDTDNLKQNLVIAAHIADTFIACTELAPEDEPQKLARLNRMIEDNSQHKKGINLVVPCKINVNDWANNSQMLFSIADRVGYENIADLIPACDRIHLLSCDHKHVWELKQRNIKNVFDNLIARLEII